MTIKDACKKFVEDLFFTLIMDTNLYEYYEGSEGFDIKYPDDVKNIYDAIEYGAKLLEKKINDSEEDINNTIKYVDKSLQKLDTHTIEELCNDKDIKKLDEYDINENYWVNNICDENLLIKLIPATCLFSGDCYPNKYSNMIIDFLRDNTPNLKLLFTKTQLLDDKIAKLQTKHIEFHRARYTPNDYTTFEDIRNFWCDEDYN